MERRSGRVPSTLLLIAVTLLACAGPGASAAPSAARPTPASTLTPTSRPSPSPTPFPTWSFYSEVPTPDEPGTLLLLHRSWGDEGLRTPLLVVTANGLVVAMQWPDDGAGVVVKRRLLPAGIEHVRAALVAVGLFDRDRKRQMIEPWPAGGAGDQLQVRLGDTTVSVGRNLAPAEYYEPSAAWDRFDALVENLRSLDRWLSEDLWRDTRWTPFHAATFCMRLDSSTAYQDLPSLDSTNLAAPGGILPLASFGTPGINAGTRFGSMSAADTYRFAAAVADLANSRVLPDLRGERIPLDAGAAVVGFPRIRDAGADWLVDIEALMPHAACVDV